MPPPHLGREGQGPLAPRIVLEWDPRHTNMFYGTTQVSICMLLFSHILMLDFKHVILNVKTFVKTVLRYINIEWLLGVGWGEGGRATNANMSQDPCEHWCLFSLRSLECLAQEFIIALHIFTVVSSLGPTNRLKLCDFAFIHHLRAGSLKV